MARVDLAVRREGSFQRLYAVKRLHAHLVHDPEVRLMFVDEARVAGLLRHPNVVSVLDVGEDAEGPFLVMDLVEGVSAAAIAERAAGKGMPVPLEVALRIAAEAAVGLHAAHELTGADGQPLDLVHRDVSPQNILVGFDGMVRVADFGIARALGRTARTSTGILKGKLGYMSPEALSFHGQDRRSDLFSLGVTLYELLTSRRLYPSSAGEASARRILEEPPPDLADQREDAPPALVALFFKLLAKSPDHRPATARVVEQALREMLTDLEGPLMGTGEYLLREFGDERDQMQQAMAQALADGPQVQSTRRSTGKSTGKTQRRLAIAGAGMAVVGATWLAARVLLSPAATTPGARSQVVGVAAYPPAPVAPTRAAAAQPAAATKAIEAPRAQHTAKDRSGRARTQGDTVKLWGWK